MTNQEYHQMLRDTTSAIHAKEATLIVETGHPQPDLYFFLPSPQEAGTVVQRAAYALQAAKKFLSNHGINEPSIF